MVFVLVLAYVSQRDLESLQLRDIYESKNVCNSIANQISYLYSSSKNSESVFFSNYDFNVGSTYVEIGNTYCYFQGIAIPGNLQKGNVKLTNIEGVVELENI
jgi:hypothetical protein